MRRLIITFSLALAVSTSQALAQTQTDAAAAAARIILAADARAAGLTPDDIKFESVIVSGDQSLISYKMGERLGLVGLVVRTYGWTMLLHSEPSGGPSDPWYMEAYNPFKWDETMGLPFGPTPQVLREAGFPQAIVDRAALLDPVVKAAAARSGAYRCVATERKNQQCFQPFDEFCCPGAQWLLEPLVRDHDGRFVYQVLDGWALGYGYAIDDAPPNSHFYQATTGPQPLKDFDVPVRDLLFTRLSVSAASPVTFQQFTVDVRPPFVLLPAPYRLRVDTGEGTFTQVPGNLHDNVLHFAIPTLQFFPNAPISFEVTPSVLPGISW